MNVFLFLCDQILSHFPFFSGTLMVMMQQKYLAQNLLMFHQCGSKSREGNVIVIQRSRYSQVNSGTGHNNYNIIGNITTVKTGRSESRFFQVRLHRFLIYKLCLLFYCKTRLPRFFIMFLIFCVINLSGVGVILHCMPASQCHVLHGLLVHKVRYAAQLWMY